MKIPKNIPLSSKGTVIIVQIPIFSNNHFSQSFEKTIEKSWSRISQLIIIASTLIATGSSNANISNSGNVSYVTKRTTETMICRNP